MLKNAVVLLAIAAISLFAACNLTDTETSLEIEQDALYRKGAGPENPRKGEFYPLAIGNTWSYTGEFSMRFGTGETFGSSRNETRTIIGTEVLFDREYILEEQFITEQSMFFPDTFTYWVRHRQDRAGLYSADVAISDPPGEENVAANPSGGNHERDMDRWDELWKRAIDDLAPDNRDTAERVKEVHFNKIKTVNDLIGRRTGSAFLTGPPGGILPAEIQRLKYPMHTRQEWIIRDEPLFYSVVEGMDVLDLPAGRMNGWRIFIHNEFLGENDIVYFWYSRQGFLCMDVHLETEDNTFGDIIITDETLYLTEYDLEGKGKKNDDPENGKKTDSKGRLLSDL